MQKSYLMTLYELAEKDKNVLLLLADSGTSFDLLFKKYLPDQVFDFGIAEENMVAAAAGMATCGKIPFVFTASAFLSYRSYEFIRDDVCFQNNNVKFIGMGEGLSWSTLGPTHHTTEELSLLRSLPNLVVLSPSSPSMVAECVKFAYKHNGPVYIRIGMGGEKELYSEAVDIKTNNAITSGEDVCLFVTGGITAEVVDSVNILKEQGINAKVVDVCSIKPFNKKSALNEINDIKKIVTVEEHSIVGGLGSIISELLVEEERQAKLLKIGLNDKFAEGYGTHEQVRTQNGLDANSIAEKISSWLKKEK